MELQILHATSGIVLTGVACRPEFRGRGSSEYAVKSAIVFVHRGTFCLHRRSRMTVADPLALLAFRTGDEYCVSHPVGQGDDCVEIGFDDHVVDAMRAAEGLVLPSCLADPAAAARRADPSIVWAVGILVRKARLGRLSNLELEELALSLLRHASGDQAEKSAGIPAKWRRVHPASARKVERAKLLLFSEPARKWTLSEIASRVETSPFHLTRLFRAITGMPLHRYLVLTRLAIALDRILDGQDDFAALACEFGFSSHSHLAVAFRSVYGLTPSAARAGAQPSDAARLS